MPKTNSVLAHSIDNIGDIKNKPNSVSEFLEKNWRSVVLCAAVVLGANASVMEMLARVLGH